MSITETVMLITPTEQTAAVNENVLINACSSVCVRGEGAEANTDHDGAGHGEPAG